MIVYICQCYFFNSSHPYLPPLCPQAPSLLGSSVPFFSRFHIVVVQLFSFVWLFAIPWTAAHLKPISSESEMPSNHLVLCHPLLLLPSTIPSIRVFSNESVFCIRWPKYWSFSFSISPSNEYSGLISFRIDLFDLLAVQGTLKSLLQHHSSKTSILQCSAFFMVCITDLVKKEM